MQGNTVSLLIFILYCLHIVLHSRALARETHLHFDTEIEDDIEHAFVGYSRLMQAIAQAL